MKVYRSCPLQQDEDKKTSVMATYMCHDLLDHVLCSFVHRRIHHRLLNILKRVLPAQKQSRRISVFLNEETQVVVILEMNEVFPHTDARPKWLHLGLSLHINRDAPFEWKHRIFEPFHAYDEEVQRLHKDGFDQIFLFCDHKIGFCTSCTLCAQKKFWFSLM